MQKTKALNWRFSREYQKSGKAEYKSWQIFVFCWGTCSGNSRRAPEVWSCLVYVSFLLHDLVTGGIPHAGSWHIILTQVPYPCVVHQKLPKHHNMVFVSHIPMCMGHILILLTFYHMPAPCIRHLKLCMFLREWLIWFYILENATSLYFKTRLCVFQSRYIRNMLVPWYRGWKFIAFTEVDSHSNDSYLKSPLKHCF